MNITDAIILGIIQGIFEWLPVSSEGMTTLYLIARNYTLQEAIPISIWLHTGTLLAAAIYFRKDLKTILKNIPDYLKKKPTQTTRITTFLIISTACTGIVGLPILLYSLDKLNFSGAHATAFIGILLIFTGIIQKNTKNNPKEKKNNHHRQHNNRNPTGFFSHARHLKIRHHNSRTHAAKTQRKRITKTKFPHEHPRSLRSRNRTQPDEQNHNRHKLPDCNYNILHNRIRNNRRINPICTKSALLEILHIPWDTKYHTISSDTIVSAVIK